MRGRSQYLIQHPRVNQQGSILCHHFSNPFAAYLKNFRRKKCRRLRNLIFIKIDLLNQIESSIEAGILVVREACINGDASKFFIELDISLEAIFKPRRRVAKVVFALSHFLNLALKRLSIGFPGLHGRVKIGQVPMWIKSLCLR